MNNPIYKQATTIGDGKSPVVINTSGKVVVKVNDKYFPLNFQEVTNSSTTIEDNDSFPIKIIPKEDIPSILPSLSEDTLILSPEGEITLYYNGELISLGQLVIPDVLTLSTLVLTKNLKVFSKELVDNLNANYLEGKRSRDFVSSIEQQTIKFPWKFEKSVEFTKLAGDKVFIDAKTGVINATSLIVDEVTTEHDLDFEGNTVKYEPNTIYLGKGTIIEDIESEEVQDSDKIIKIILKDASKFTIEDEVNYLGNDGKEYIGVVIGISTQGQQVTLQAPRDAAIPLIGTVIYCPNKVSFVGDIGELHLMRDHSVKLGDTMLVNSEGEITYFMSDLEKTTQSEGVTTNIMQEVQILQKAVLGLQEQINDIKNIINNL